MRWLIAFIRRVIKMIRRRFFMGASGGGGGSRLPDIYQEVEYIASSGAQYLDLGFPLKVDSSNAYDFECKFSPVNTTGEQAIVSAWSTDNPNLVFHRDDSAHWRFYLGSDGYSPVSGSVTVGTAYTLKAELTSSSKVLKVNETPISALGSGDVTGNVNLYAFACNTGSIANRFASIKMYYLKVTHNGLLIRDLVSCYRKSDGKPGMYDLVNKVFYVNQGSEADFTLGPAALVPSGCILEYKFDNQTMEDTSGNGYNGTQGSCTFTSGLVGGYAITKTSGTSAQFPSSVPLTLPVTLSVWLQAPPNRTARHDAFYILTTSAVLACTVVANSNWSTIGLTPDQLGMPFVADEIMHIVITMDENRLCRLYKNGVFFKENPIGTSTVNYRYFCGSNSVGTTEAWTGKIDNFRIFNRILTDEEIATLYDEPNWPKPDVRKYILYDAGDECTDITGGWAVVGDNTQIATKNADSLYISCNNQNKANGFVTTNSIDFTPYSKLKATVNITSKYSDPYGNISAYASNVPWNGNSATGSAATSTTVGTITIEVDISNISASYPIAVHQYVATGYIYKVWLE